MSDELVELMDKPLKWTENALTALTKKTAASFWGKFKRQLSTASEPILRKNMGERYLSSEAIGGGVVIWLASTIVALAWPDVRSIAPVLLSVIHLDGLGNLFQLWPLTGLVGGALILFHLKLGLENTALMSKYRDDGTAYHTQSRGIPRWGDSPLMPVLIMAVLFLFDLPAGILFVASISMSAKLAGEQQAAIYARYLDALDAKIEQEYLEKAILGKCPAEITQLHKPLPAAMNADLRENIAAAAVGKPVKIVAHPQGRTGEGAQTETKPAAFESAGPLPEPPSK